MNDFAFRALKIFGFAFGLVFCLASENLEAQRRGGGGGGARGGGRVGGVSPRPQPGTVRPMPRPTPRPSTPSVRPPSRPSTLPSRIPSARPPGQPTTLPATRPSAPRPTHPIQPNPGRPIERPNRPGVNQPTLPNRPGVNRPATPPVNRPPVRRPNTLPARTPGRGAHTYLPGRNINRTVLASSRSARVVHSRTVVRTRYNNVFRNDWYQYHPGARRYWAARYPRYVSHPFVWTSTFYLAAWLGRPNYYTYNSSGYTAYDSSQLAVYYGDDEESTQYYDESYSSAYDLAEQGHIPAGSAEERQQLEQADWASIGIFSVVPIDEQDPKGMLQLFMTKDGLISGNYVDLESGQSYGVYGSVDKETMKVSIRTDADNSPVLETSLDALSQPDSIAQLLTTDGNAVSVNLVKPDQDAQN